MKKVQLYNIIIKNGEFAGFYAMVNIDSLEKAKTLLEKYWNDGNYEVVFGKTDYVVDFDELY